MRMLHPVVAVVKTNFNLFYVLSTTCLYPHLISSSSITAREGCLSCQVLANCARHPWRTVSLAHLFATPRQYKVTRATNTQTDCYTSLMSSAELVDSLKALLEDSWGHTLPSKGPPAVREERHCLAFRACPTEVVSDRHNAVLADRERAFKPDSPASDSGDASPRIGPSLPRGG